jgi:hypothetical protein
MLISAVNLGPLADYSPGLHLRVGPKNAMKTLRLQVKDEAGVTGEWEFPMPVAGGEAVLVTPRDGAPLSNPNRTEDPERLPNLARVREWQIIGDWNNVPIDAEVEAIVAVRPNDALRSARTVRAQRETEARAAAIRAEEDLRKKFPSNADLREVLPVTNRILMLHFREGRIKYGGVRPDGSFAPQGENTVYYAPMDIKAATDTARYQITSTDDAAYAKPARPVRLGYKAKGNDFNNPYETPQFLRDYWVYAEVPKPMKTGRTYTINLGAIAGNLNRYRFTFNEKALRSPTIHTSHVGYTPDAPKYAYLSQ